MRRLVGVDDVADPVIPSQLRKGTVEGVPHIEMSKVSVVLPVGVAYASLLSVGSV
jgi:hypothetical protein